MRLLLLALALSMSACDGSSASYEYTPDFPTTPVDLSKPIDFGFVPVGGERRLDVELMNRSEAESLTVGPSIFAHDFSSTIEAPIELQPGQVRGVSFVFAPRSAGIQEATGSLPPLPDVIQLRGTGVVPALRCEALQIDFGTMAWEGDAGIPVFAEVRCRNDSPVELEIRATVSGEHEELFRTVLPDSPTVAPFDDIVVPVAFQPAVREAQISATLELQLEHAEPVRVELLACMVLEEGQLCPDR